MAVSGLFGRKPVVAGQYRVKLSGSGNSVTLSFKVVPPVSSNVVVVTTTADVVNGDVSSVGALNAKPGPDGISLPEALKAADKTRGNGTAYIMFSHALNGQAIAPRSELPSINRDHVVLEGVAPDGSQAMVTIDGSSEASTTVTRQLLLVQASDVTVRWLRLIGENPQGSSTGAMRALVASPGRERGPDSGPHDGRSADRRPRPDPG